MLKKSLFLSMFLIFLMTGCDKNPTETIKTVLNIMATVRTWYSPADSSYHSNSDVYVSNFSEIPAVTINGRSEDQLWRSASDLNFDYTETFDPGTKCDLVVNHKDETISGSVTVPSKFSILQPADNDTLKSRNMELSWEQSGSTDYYEVYIYYTYTDLLGYYQHNDTLIQNIKTTSITVVNFLPPASEVNRWSWGEIYVTAVNGPEMESGVHSNLSGDTNGFLWASYAAKVIRFSYPYVQTLFFDDFQNGLSHWILEGDWGLTGHYYLSPDSALTDSPRDYGYYYNPNTNISATINKSFNLSNVVNPYLMLYSRVYVEENADYANIQTSTDGGTTWVTIISFTGNEYLYPQEYDKISLKSVEGKSDVMLRFNLTSDGQTEYDGWYIDDVEIKGTVPSRASIAKPAIEIIPEEKLFLISLKKFLSKLNYNITLD